VGAPIQREFFWYSKSTISHF